jgi:hypothetical protein
VHDKSGEKLATLFGKWDEAMYYVMGDIGEKHKSYDPMSEAVQLWQCASPAKHPTRYGLTAFATTVNELTPGLKVLLFQLSCPAPNGDFVMDLICELVEATFKFVDLISVVAQELLMVMPSNDFLFWVLYT